MMKTFLTLVLTLSAAVAMSAAPTGKYITYEQFGAVGDGIHDDMKAIIAAHDEANRLGIPVKADDSRTYYIGDTHTSAVIRTDVDFGKAHFVIDDVNLTSLQNIFVVKPDKESYEILLAGPLKRGQKSLGVKLKEESLVQIENDSHRVFIRYGLNQNKGTAQQEVVVADRKGRIRPGTDIVWDYEKVTRLTVFPIDTRKITIRGGIFTTIANRCESTYNYHGRGILINRSNVTVEGVTHLVTGEGEHGAPYSGFLYVSKAADVVISNCTLTAHKTYIKQKGAAGKPVSMGSYDLGANRSVNVFYRNCTQTTDIDDTRYWGVFASNFSKCLRMDGCTFSRFDAHMGVENVTLTNCTFGHMGVRMVGFGTIRLENCEMRYNTVVALRSDYGSSWDGDIIIKNCVLRPVKKDIRELTILNGSNHGRHDFGYECCLPGKITVDGLTVDDSLLAGNPKYTGPAVFSTFNRNADEEGLLPYRIEGSVKMKGVTVASGNSFKVSSNPDLFKKVKVKGL